MAVKKSKAANSPEITADTSGKWGHVAPDADGDIAFHSRADAEEYARDHKLDAKTIMPVGTAFVIPKS